MYVVLIALLLAQPAPSTQHAFDLMRLTSCSSKGRFQDLDYNPRPRQASQLIAMGPAVIPFLISRLESVRRYRQSPICLWPSMVEGDMALTILMDLFIDPAQENTTLPESCWTALYGPGAGPDVPGWEVLRTYLTRVGRKAVRRKWERIWTEHRDATRWDGTARFFRIEGRKLSRCS